MIIESNNQDWMIISGLPHDKSGVFSTPLSTYKNHLIYDGIFFELTIAIKSLHC